MKLSEKKAAALRTAMLEALLKGSARSDALAQQLNAAIGAVRYIGDILTEEGLLVACDVKVGGRKLREYRLGAGTIPAMWRDFRLHGTPDKRATPAAAKISMPAHVPAAKPVVAKNTGSARLAAQDIPPARPPSGARAPHATQTAPTAPGGLADGSAQSIASTLTERGSRYGKYHDNARTTQSIKRAMADSPNWTRLSATQREALDMIAHEIARILNGDPDYHDSWHALHRCAFHIEGLGHAGGEVRK